MRRDPRALFRNRLFGNLDEDLLPFVKQIGYCRLVTFVSWETPTATAVVSWASIATSTSIAGVSWSALLAITTILAVARKVWRFRYPLSIHLFMLNAFLD